MSSFSMHSAVRISIKLVGQLIVVLMRSHVHPYSFLLPHQKHEIEFTLIKTREHLNMQSAQSSGNGLFLAASNSWTREFVVFEVTAGFTFEVL